MNTALVTIGFLIIAILAFFAGRWHGMSKRSKQLSEALEQKEEELADLKSNVNEHFSETARLFTNLTEEYKSLYQHLAKGANKLSDENFKLSLAAPASEALIEESEIIAGDIAEEITDSTDETIDEATTQDDTESKAVTDLEETVAETSTTESEAGESEEAVTDDKITEEEPVRPVDYARPEPLGEDSEEKTDDDFDATEAAAADSENQNEPETSNRVSN